MPENRDTAAEMQDRAKLIERLALIGAVLGALSVGLYAVLYFQNGAWQILADAGFVALAVGCMIPARWLARRGQLEEAGYWILFAIFLAYGGGGLVWSGTLVYNLLAGVLLIFLVGTLIRPRRWEIWLIAAVFYTASLLVVTWVEPLPRYNIASSSVLRLHVPLVTGALVLLTLWQMLRLFQRGNIRTRLLVAFVAVALLPIVIMIGGVVLGGMQAIRQQSLDSLEALAALKESQIDVWLEDMEIDLGLALEGPQMMAALGDMLQAPDGSNEYEAARAELEARLRQVAAETGRFEELFLLDPQGRVVVSTDPAQVGQLRSNHAYFREGLAGPYAGRAYSPLAGATAVHVSRPLSGEGGETVAVLVGRASLDRLGEIMAERKGLEKTAEAYLVSIDRRMLTPNRFGEQDFTAESQGIDEVVVRRNNGSALYDNYRSVPVAGAYRWLPELEAALLVEQQQAETFGAMSTMLLIAGGVALAGILVAIGVALIVTRGIADPLVDLVETATEIAEGDLSRAAPVRREDEIGRLARAFNSMTAQLRESIGGLERRVAERTQDLELRSRYLEASADVGRAASSILETDQLVQQVVNLIQERFGLYFVGLYLLGEPFDPGRHKDAVPTGGHRTESAGAGEEGWAVLQAGTGEAGQLLLARGHRHRIGVGMVGWCIANAEPRVALEAGEDAVRLATAELPDTRSEVALPLRSRRRVLGALTVQHTEPGAFDEELVVVLQTMADQVAVALDNAGLFAERQEALEATQRAYGDLSREAWQEMLQDREVAGYRSDERGLTVARDAGGPEVAQALRTGRTVRGEQAGAAGAAGGRQPLAVPIRVRGEIVGVLDTYKPAEAGEWTPEEIALLESIAEQLDPALESARLYQDTQRRVTREQAIRQVTERMRSAVEIEDILQNTVAELARAMGAQRAYVRLGTESELLRDRAGVDTGKSEEV